MVIGKLAGCMIAVIVGSLFVMFKHGWCAGMATYFLMMAIIIAITM